MAQYRNTANPNVLKTLVLNVSIILGQNRRPRVTIRSSFGHLLFWAKTAGRGSRFGVLVSVTYDFGPKPQAACHGSE